MLTSSSSMGIHLNFFYALFLVCKANLLSLAPLRIGLIKLISNGKNQQYNRKYLKVQDIIAEIGALIKVIKIFIKLHILQSFVK